MFVLEGHLLFSYIILSNWHALSIFCALLIIILQVGLIYIVIHLNSAVWKLHHRISLALTPKSEEAENPNYIEAATKAPSYLKSSQCSAKQFVMRKDMVRSKQ